MKSCIIPALLRLCCPTPIPAGKLKTLSRRECFQQEIRLKLGIMKDKFDSRCHYFLFTVKRLVAALVTFDRNLYEKRSKKRAVDKDLTLFALNSL